MSQPNAHLALLGLGVLQIAQLRLPLKGGRALHALVNQALHDVARMHVNCAQCDQLFAVACGHIAIDQLDKLAQLCHLPCIYLLLEYKTPVKSLLGV